LALVKFLSWLVFARFFALLGDSAGVAVV